MPTSIFLAQKSEQMDAVIDSDFRSRTPGAWHLVPIVLAVEYPWFLELFYQAVEKRQFLLSVADVLLVFSVPVVAFVSLACLARSPVTPRSVLLRRLAHIAIASPPLYVIIGVFLFLMKIEGADKKVWLGTWAAVLVGFLLVWFQRPSGGGWVPPRATTVVSRVLHGVAALVVLLAFLIPHVGNHVVGLFGPAEHKAVMLVLRNLYRAGVVEPTIIGLMLFLVVSGICLLGPKLNQRSDLLGAVQTASGAYLVVFVASHINAVFTLARYFGTETDYAWATGLPIGLVHDAWNVRLIPHYSLGVFLLLCHVACGLRNVLLAHEWPQRRADHLTWALIAASTIWAALVTAGMVGIRL